MRLIYAEIRNLSSSFLLTFSYLKINRTYEKLIRYFKEKQDKPKPCSASS